MAIPDKLKKHRVIGIRHALKRLKKAGLIEEEILFPDDAVDNLQNEILSVARKWYKIGAKRGALETLDAFLDRQFALQTSKTGKIEILARMSSVKWERRLNVTVGNAKQRVPKHLYKLTLQDLGFEV
jgi:hypothetical protein